MSEDVHIRRVRALGPDALSLQKLSVPALREALEQELRAQDLHIPGELIIRRLEVVIDSGDPRAWSRAVLKALRVRLRGGRSGPFIERDLAWFPDRESAWALALQGRALGESTPWWLESLEGEAARILQRPSAGELVMRRWLEQQPLRAWSRLARLLREQPRVLRLFSDQGVPSLLALDRAARAAQEQALGLNSEAPEPLVKRSPPAALAPALAQAESPPLRLLAALAFVKEADPGLSAAEAEALAQAWAVPTTSGLAGAGEAVAQRLPKETLPEGRLPEEPLTQARRPAWDPEQARPSVESAPAEPEARRHGAPEALITHCAGLLFLLRPLARLGFLDRSPRPRLLALGREALQRVLSPLGSAARQRALAAETPLLQAFSGLEPLPDPDPQEESELIQEALDRLCQALPQDLSPRPQDLLTVLPGLPGVLALPEPQRPLAGLLLRTARLSLDPVSATLRFTSDQIDLALRRGGWDIDPGWFPPVGRVIRFVYEEPR